ncbi:MAG TPA: anaerobic ribonucleoside-triphosphate reductase [Candidatus Limnocylindrales bacterium]|nr:anaerobic ribonucleoside-triphosphate reductase [Candidatus Limnocylindrales bacterium]
MNHTVASAKEENNPIEVGTFHEIRKRDGRLAAFDSEKITDAIFKAARAVGGNDRGIAENLTVQIVENLCQAVPNGATPTVEEVQDAVEVALIENGHARTAKAYIIYRDRRTRIREAKSELMDVVKEILVETNRENANVSNSPSAKMLQIAMAASKKYYLNNLLPDEYARAHDDGTMHIHDLDYYSKTLNCLQIDLSRLMSEGFNTGYGYIRPPKRIASAAAQAAIILQSNQNDMFGGQSYPHFDRSMGELIRSLKEKPAYEEIYQSMEGLIYNLNTMHSRAGAQVPFSSINLGTDTTEEGRLVSKAILEAFLRGLGRGESPIFPNLVFRIKEGVNFNPEDPNYELYRLALQVTARRMNPTFSFMDSSFNKPYGDEVSYMGCRTRVIANRHGAEVSAGRGNIAPVTLNLPRVALECRGQQDLFFIQLDRLMRLGAKQLLHRYEVLSRLRAADLPFLMGQRLYLDSDKLKTGDSIGDVIKHGTLAIGFIGLAETLHAMIGKHHGEDSEALELGLKIIEHMRRRLDSYADEYDLNFVLVATPAEGLAGRFVAIDRERFGVLPGITDKEYYTNSFHIPVNYILSIFDKINTEGRFHRLCNAGHISYIELAAPPVHNIDAVDRVLRQMAAADVGYGGINFPLDECRICSNSGVFNQSCPQCGSTDFRRIRRITGYLSTDDRFNGAKLSELNNRRVHFVARGK